MTVQASKRTKTRALKSVARKERSSEQPSQSKLLHERLAQVEAQVARLGDAFDQNTDVFSESFKMNEGITSSMQKVVAEMARGEKLTWALADGTPDWREYLRCYWLCMLMADFASWLGSLQEQAVVAEASSLVATPDDEPVVETHIFGG